MSGFHKLKSHIMKWSVYVYVSSSCLHANQQGAITLVLIGRISFLKMLFCSSHASDSNGIVKNHGRQNGGHLRNVTYNCFVI